VTKEDMTRKELDAIMDLCRLLRRDKPTRDTVMRGMERAGYSREETLKAIYEITKP